AGVVALGEAGSPDVRVRDAVSAAIDTQGAAANSGFHREATPLNTVVVGDGSDDSAGLPQEFIGWYVGLGSRGTFSCLVDAGAAGSDCAAVATPIGGVVRPIDGDALEAV